MQYPPCAQLSIRQTRGPGQSAEGQVRVTGALPIVPARPGKPLSVFDSSGKIIAEPLPGRQRRACMAVRQKIAVKKRPKLKVEPSE